VGIAAHTSNSLVAAEIDSTTTALRALVEHRDDLAKPRTQTLNRLHTVLAHLIPGGANRDLNRERAADLLRTVRPRDTAGKTLRALAAALAADLISELHGLDRRIDKAAHAIETAVEASGTTLTELHGIGALTAVKIVSRVGSIRRFHSPAAFASYTGTAPIEVSTGDVVRHRLSGAGDRQLNYCLHVMAFTQIRRNTPGRSYYQRKRASGKSHSEAMRCLKRRLSDTVYRQLLNDAHTTT
jgi:transposase